VLCLYWSDPTALRLACIEPPPRIPPCAIRSYCPNGSKSARDFEPVGLCRTRIYDPSVLCHSCDQLRHLITKGAVSKHVQFENSNIARLRRMIIAAKGKLAEEARNASN